ncbi:type III-A CRISPR-associated protein Cas10/Csm1 [Leptolyngbya sp. 'hensonii']|uniref:type III-A CRISPR-associated protein Cas10/Csm1 n=1 Tax=Leptolyngbya sp. 'hensonii' TaxID=1922337 RepID=UPI00094FDFF1|nr:type III-A CRISPR-associated protein Cas10/Csm1 [Leptolyngbya sp. 'hensonii']OLP19212.1 type III-A CRISPR-associated protein Cas10/Csm1 [Leptolyngbya sp. 'hensonii']
MDKLSSYQAALQVAQQAIARLAIWVEARFSYQPENLVPAVDRAMKILGWQDAEIGALCLLFDQVRLPKQGEEEHKAKIHYCPAIAIEDANPPIPYPQTDLPDLSELKGKIKTALESLTQADWENLSLLTVFLEKYGSFLSFGQPDVALIDQMRITAAIAAALADNPDTEQLSLVAGDLSGIQKFIYTISSDGALKSLRARSFYLELVTEEVVQQLLITLKLPRSNVIYAGGGNLYLLAPIQGIQGKIDSVRQDINQWLRKEFQGKVFLALDHETFNLNIIATPEFQKVWQQAIDKVNQRKTVRFCESLPVLLQKKVSYEPCKVCHRDDEADLKPLTKDSNVLACGTCRRMFRLGQQILQTNAIIRTEGKPLARRYVHLVNREVYYNLFRNREEALQTVASASFLLVNNWRIEDYQTDQGSTAIPLLLGNYAQQSAFMEEGEVEDGKQILPGIMTADEFANLAEGINRVGYLRMDVDKLGKIFAKGLQSYSLPKLAGLSRQMSYFFKVYLNSLADDRWKNFSSQSESFKFKLLTTNDRRNLLFIYAGGDDLFVAGSWNEVVEFAFDVYQSFRAYTGNHPDITLSGGISLEIPKFPLYQAAEESGEAEDQAKGNGRDSLGLFGTAFKWDEWLGATTPDQVDRAIKQLDDHAKKHLDAKDQPQWLGIFPFVSQLQTDELSDNQSRSFVRNLLITAEVQEHAVKEKQREIDDFKKAQTPKTDEAPKLKQLKTQQQEIRYYLHLPKIAYTLARLPSRIRDSESFQPVRTSLKSPYNAPYFRAIATWIELLTRST